MLLCTFLAAGPSVAIVAQAQYFVLSPHFRGPPPPGAMAAAMAHGIAKVAFLFTGFQLMQGVCNLFWVPLMIKYGRRPVYVASFTLYTGIALWAGFATTYSSELCARLILGLAAGAAECLAPLTIVDVFFLHQRGAIMA